MKTIRIHNRCSDFDSYRASRVKSLFNAETGCNFDLEADLPADDPAWRIGVIVGSSGSGKSSIGRQFWPGVPIADLSAGRPVTTIFHTSHPGLAAGLRRNRKWRQVSAVLYGSNREKCIRTMLQSNVRKLQQNPNAVTISQAGFGGHFRAVQGFRYVGEEGLL